MMTSFREPHTNYFKINKQIMQLNKKNKLKNALACLRKIASNIARLLTDIDDVYILKYLLLKSNEAEKSYNGFNLRNVIKKSALA